MKNLDIATITGLIRTGNVHRVFIIPYPVVDGGGWFLDVDHSDNGLTRHLHTKREGLRIFKTSDTAIDTLRECGYLGPVVVRMQEQNIGSLQDGPHDFFDYDLINSMRGNY